MPPLHKRPFTFWLPAFGLLFLLWAWADSRRSGSTVAVGYSPIINVGMGAEGSCLTLRSTRHSDRAIALSPTPPRSPFFAYSSRYELPPQPSIPWFPRPRGNHSGISLEMTGIPLSITRTLQIPFWCIIPVYTAGWLLLLTHWRKRLKRRDRPTVSPPAPPQTDLDLGT
jgi:hypothetical protein